MAWSVSSLADPGARILGDSPFTTASISPTADRLVVVVMMTREVNEADNHTHTVSGLSLSWSRIHNEEFSSATGPDLCTSVHIADSGGSPGSGTLTLTSTKTATIDDCWYFVFEMDGSNVANASPLSSVIVQSKSARDDGGDNSGSVTLDSSVTSGNVVFGVYCTRDSTTTTITPDATWTAQLGETIDNAQAIHGSWYNGSDKATFSATDNGTASDGDLTLIFEVDEVTGTPTAPAAPTAASGTASGDTITGTFTDNSSGTATHRAYYKRSTDSIWTLAGSLPATETSFDFEWLVANTEYDIGFTSYDSDAESAMTKDLDILTGVVRLVSGSFL